MVRDYLRKKELQFSEEFYGKNCVVKLLDDKYVDFVIENKKTIIEVHGPTHYIAPSKQLSMTSEASERILRKKGWNVLNVPFFGKFPVI